MSVPRETGPAPLDAWAAHSPEVSRTLRAAQVALSDEASLVLAAIADDPAETDLVLWACSLQSAANRLGAAAAAFDASEPGDPTDAVEVALTRSAM